MVNILFFPSLPNGDWQATEGLNFFLVCYDPLMAEFEDKLILFSNRYFINLSIN